MSCFLPDLFPLHPAGATSLWFIDPMLSLVARGFCFTFSGAIWISPPFYSMMLKGFKLLLIFKCFQLFFPSPVISWDLALHYYPLKGCNPFISEHSDFSNLSLETEVIVGLGRGIHCNINLNVFMWVHFLFLCYFFVHKVNWYMILELWYNCFQLYP